MRLPASKVHPASPNGLAYVVQSPTMNIDIAPFLLDLVGFEPDPDMDGRSMLPLLDAAAAPGTPNTAATATAFTPASSPMADRAGAGGRTFLMEYFPIPGTGNDLQVTQKGEDGWCTDPDVRRTPCPTIPVIVDSVNNTWACVRSLYADYAEQDEIYCNFFDATGIDVHWVRDSANANFEEYYDMRKEPWQLHNEAQALPAGRKATLQARLNKLMLCKGQQECNNAAISTVD